MGFLEAIKIHALKMEDHATVDLCATFNDTVSEIFDQVCAPQGFGDLSLRPFLSNTLFWCWAAFLTVLPCPQTTILHLNG